MPLSEAQVPSSKAKMRVSIPESLNHSDPFSLNLCLNLNLDTGISIQKVLISILISKFRSSS